MQIGLASDHVGFEHKERLKARVPWLIVDVAFGAGFENHAHFISMFGNIVGITGRQFQRSSERDSGGVSRPSLPVVECC